MKAESLRTSLARSSLIIAVSYFVVGLILGVTAHRQWYYCYVDGAILIVGDSLGARILRVPDAVVSTRTFMVVLTFQFIVPFCTYLATYRGDTKLSLAFLTFLAPWSTILSSALLQPTDRGMGSVQTTIRKQVIKVVATGIGLCFVMATVVVAIQIIRTHN